MNMIAESTKLFDLGEVRIANQAADFMAAAGDTVTEFLARHQANDSSLRTPTDLETNRHSIGMGHGVVVSTFATSLGVRLRVVTSLGGVANYTFVLVEPGRPINIRADAASGVMLS